ncbi:MAG TPA: ATP synthase F1 subunit gamma [Candidatus Binatia bacterium]|jgi:F-type H+-transporting ATPase subunit gamma|nr:ATP synthase F1 subunit gamma [Candidatus Binatia bacterium]
MPSPRDIRRRIKSVKNMAQITRAMQMVAASKMRRAQQSALASRPYASMMNEVLGNVTFHAGDFTHPLMEQREVRKRGVILVSSDKGLCGSLNSNLMREAAKLDKQTTVFITAGRKAAQFIARTRRQLAAEFTYKDAPQFGEARAISKFARDLFLRGEVDRVDVLFTKFISTLSQKPEVQPLLPVGEFKPVSVGIPRPEQEEKLLQGATEFLFEPDAEQVLGALLPHSINFEIYHILLEAKASEQSARMVAMKNATDNANQLIKDLTIEYNKLRQANITKELLEIASAAMAMA